jgi:prepilin-type N-terminal cleavage/methylation domain-containing protein
MDNKKQTGFTIVELLIVIVVIGILAAITIVAYNGIQNRANDTAVQADLRNVGAKILEFKTINDALPAGNSTDFGPMNIKVSRNAYGAHYTPAGSNGYNFIYCQSGAMFAVVAASKSGTVYVFRDGTVSVGVGPLSTHTATCPNNGMPTGTGGSWFFSNGVWQAWVS